METNISRMPNVNQQIVDNIVKQLKSQGIFDQFRKDCLADVDTKPSYQNLRQRVEGYVSKFLSQQSWNPSMNKNQLRDELRRQINESGMLSIGVEHVVDQIVHSKANRVFLPQIEIAARRYLGLDRTQSQQYEEHGCFKEGLITDKDGEKTKPVDFNDNNENGDGPRSRSSPLIKEVPSQHFNEDRALDNANLHIAKPEEHADEEIESKETTLETKPSYEDHSVLNTSQETGSGDDELLPPGVEAITALPKTTEAEILSRCEDTNSSFNSEPLIIYDPDRSSNENSQEADSNSAKAKNMGMDYDQSSVEFKMQPEELSIDKDLQKDDINRESSPEKKLSEEIKKGDEATDSKSSFDTEDKKTLESEIKKLMELSDKNRLEQEIRRILEIESKKMVEKELKKRESLEATKSIDDSKTLPSNHMSRSNSSSDLSKEKSASKSEKSKSDSLSRSNSSSELSKDKHPKIEKSKSSDSMKSVKDSSKSDSLSSKSKSSSSEKKKSDSKTSISKSSSRSSSSSHKTTSSSSKPEKADSKSSLEKTKSESYKPKSSSSSSNKSSLKSSSVSKSTSKSDEPHKSSKTNVSKSEESSKVVKSSSSSKCEDSAKIKNSGSSKSEESTKVKSSYSSKTDPITKTSNKTEAPKTSSSIFRAVKITSQKSTSKSGVTTAKPDLSKKKEQWSKPTQPSENLKKETETHVFKSPEPGEKKVLPEIESSETDDDFIRALNKYQKEEGSPEEDKKSDVSVSSVHTSDLSSFDDEISLSSSDELKAVPIPSPVKEVKKIPLKDIKEITSTITTKDKPTSGRNTPAEECEAVYKETKTYVNENVGEPSSSQREELTSETQTDDDDKSRTGIRSGLRRQRKINPKYASDEYSSIFNKTRKERKSVDASKQAKTAPITESSDNRKRRRFTVITLDSD